MGFESWDRNDLLELVDPYLFSDAQWRPAEVSARLAVVLTTIVLVTVAARNTRLWRTKNSPVVNQPTPEARVARTNAALLSSALVVIVASAAYPALLVRKTLRLTAIEPVPPGEEPFPNFGNPPTPLTPAERESVGNEIPPEHPTDIWLVTQVGVLPFNVNYCPIHERPLKYERIPFHPDLPGHVVREGFPFGQLVFAQRLGIHVKDWGAERCADCVTLHERYLGKWQAELRYRAEHQGWGGDW